MMNARAWPTLVEFNRLNYDEDLLVPNVVGGRFRRVRQKLPS